MTFTPKEITAMAKEAGFGRNGFSECLVRGSRGVWIDVQDEVNRLVALVAEKAAVNGKQYHLGYYLSLEAASAAYKKAAARFHTHNPVSEGA